MEANIKKRIIVGISGASGIPLAIDLLKKLKNIENWQSHLVISQGAKLTLEYETQYTMQSIEALADYVYDFHDIAAPLASGTFRSEGMVIVPCSMKTVAGIASGYSDNLLLRAADVTIKEHKKLVLITRECPLSPVHLKNMYELSLMGINIMPAVLTFYNNPTSIEHMIEHITGKILDRFGIDMQGFRRWKDI